MWLQDDVLKQDLDYLVSLDCIPWEKLQGSTILITGATGLIGYNLISGLIYADIRKKLDLKIIALVRNLEKAKEKFSEQLRDSNSLKFILGEVENLPEVRQSIDYIVHGASPTASSFFVENPVETIKTAVIGTINVLELAKNKNVKGLVYLSSMEIYGAPKSETALSEADLGYMDPLLVRNCYPESKRQCEALCAAYASEYNVPAMSVRLAQTFGPGIDRNDNRVFVQFVKSVIEKKDIVLLTDGSSKRCCLYTIDAVSAILTVLLKGETGQAYNAGNPETYCSVRDMAEMVVQTFGENKMQVRILKNEEDGKKFPPPHFYNLEVKRILALGWNASKKLQEMYHILFKEMGY